jgi:hypothetical protein
MFGITVPAITSAARTLAGYLAVWLVAKGLIVEGESELVVTGIVTVVGLVASIYYRRTTAIVAQAAALPEVTKVVTTPAVAAAVDSPAVKTT